MVGAQTLEHPLLLFTVQQQGAESETEQPGLEPVPTWAAGTVYGSLT